MVTGKVVAISCIALACSTLSAACRAQDNFTQALEFGAGKEFLSGSANDWQLGYLAYERQVNNTWLGYARYQKTKRYNLTDDEWLFGSYFNLNENWQTHIELSQSPTNRVRPQTGANIWLTRSFGRGFIGSAGLHRSDWETSVSQGYSVRIERYITQWRWAYTMRLDTLQSGSGEGVSHAGSLSYYGTGDDSITVAINTGEEVEKVSANQVLVSDVLGISVYGLHYTTQNWGWRWSLSFQEQGDFYNRLGANIGVRYRF
ncbi:YaiO family outer membrane beta-barrel protein [Pseudidiomarina gelatinasegens]|uniref:YaiO family outer membrane beta-barrel protein n=1 Tax=Pseudidiomarina gelatinasegens TaxID=2487740 RepID=UPI0030ED2E58